MNKNPPNSLWKILGGPDRASHNGDGVPPPAVAAAPPTAATQHKNDLPLADPNQLQAPFSPSSKYH